MSNENSDEVCSTFNINDLLEMVFDEAMHVHVND